MSSVLETYQTLKNSDSIKEDLGCALPKLTSASLTIDSLVCDATTMANTLAKWHNAQGWFQTHNSTQLGVPTETKSLLEGEWFDGKNSLSIRLLGADQYQVVEYCSTESSEDLYCYQEQPIWLRSNLLSSSANCVVYRQWFKLENHAYKPLVSQFVGFTFIKE